ncbi:MAG TPA: hypothetical protein VEO01_11865 [Pseudonocardiaceae bacterium]|nr:hypothetical protein [Pseudonocardiaceae bacterium]
MTDPRSKIMAKDALRAVARWTGSPVWRRMRPRVEAIAAEHSAMVARELRAELAELAELRAAVANLRTDVAKTHERINEMASIQDRLGPQVAAIDARVAAIERPVPGAGDQSEQAEARSLVEEVRSEHARVRARLSAVASYEHRIAQLEQKLNTLTGNQN